MNFIRIKHTDQVHLCALYEWSLLNALTPTPDMDRTVSRRSETSSRIALMSEQPNPWNILQPPGGEKPTSRCQTFPSMWALRKDHPVIPRVTFISWTTTLPLGTVRSLRSTFVPAWRVGLVVKLPSAFALEGQSSSSPRKS